MQETLKHFAENSASALEFLGIGLILIFVFVSSIQYLFRRFKISDHDQIYNSYRHQLARGILLGLEILVAADIIHTVAVDLSYSSIGVLAIVVLIRTFLSFSLELEISGRWPWQKNK
jgi:uncharacterized membrane protein